MTGQAALVTGAGGGIGLAISNALAGAGFSVAMNERSDGRAFRQAVADIRTSGGTVAPVIGDIANVATHESMLETVEAEIGDLTTLVNNAGVSVLERGDLMDVSVESYDRCQAVNARGTFFLTQAFARRLLARNRDPDVHHSIITITSSNARSASVDRGEYCVSKAAASMASRLFAVRLGAENIAAYEIQPGIIETPMTAPAMEAYRRRIDEGLTLTPRVGAPADIGAIVLALACGSFSYCTGQAIQADGGLSVRRF